MRKTNFPLVGTITDLVDSQELVNYQALLSLRQATSTSFRPSVVVWMLFRTEGLE